MKAHEILRHCRKKLGLRQHELAARLDVAQSTIAQWEADPVKPHAKEPKLSILRAVTEMADEDLSALLNSPVAEAS